MPASNPIALLARLPIRSVSLSNCVHYCAFRYGRNAYHPYESYVRSIANGEPAEFRQDRFIEFLQHYRPRDLGEALGCSDHLTAKYPLWNFPWDRIDPMKFNLQCGWSDDPDDSPDIVTHFSPNGIPRHRIEEEFFWLDRAWRSIRDNGYRPFRFRSFIRVRTFRRIDGAEAHLILEGNHRLAALSALGCKSLAVYQAPGTTVLEAKSNQWPGVVAGYFDVADALRIFHAYFEGNSNYRTNDCAAPVISKTKSDTSNIELSANLQLKI